MYIGLKRVILLNKFSFYCLLKVFFYCYYCYCFCNKGKGYYSKETRQNKDPKKRGGNRKNRVIKINIKLNELKKINQIINF